jgi:hypothetical protein
MVMIQMEVMMGDTTVGGDHLHVNLMGTTTISGTAMSIMIEAGGGSSQRSVARALAITALAGATVTAEQDHLQVHVHLPKNLWVLSSRWIVVWGIKRERQNIGQQDFFFSVVSSGPLDHLNASFSTDRRKRRLHAPSLHAFNSSILYLHTSTEKSRNIRSSCEIKSRRRSERRTKKKGVR